MNICREVVEVVASTLQLRDKRSRMTSETALLGSIPEFDSMAVVSVITSLEERFGFIVDDDEVTAETFETIGSLTAFVDSKLGG